MAGKHAPDFQLPGNLGGTPPALESEHIASLRDIVTERAQVGSQEIADEFIAAAAYACVKPPSAVHCALAATAYDIPTLACRRSGKQRRRPLPSSASWTSASTPSEIDFDASSLSTGSPASTQPSMPFLSGDT